jgi:hypothetical protein
MNLLESLLAAGNGGAVQQLGRQFGLGDDQAAAALSALVPALASGLARNATQSGGLDALMGALAGGRHDGYLDDIASLARPETAADGNGILGHILGSKDASRQVATRAAATSGVGADILKQMLPVVAAMVMGAMARTAGSGRAGMDMGLPGGMSGGLPGGVPTSLGANAGGVLDMLAPMLDRDRDGSVVDDLAGMVGEFLGPR